MKNVVGIIISVALIAACNRGSNPAKDYSDVKSVPKHGTVTGTQKGQLSPLSIDRTPTKDGVKPELHFTEGVPGEYTFDVAGDSRITEVNVRIEKGPTGATITPTENNRIWIVKWTPDRDFVKNSATSVREDLVLAVEALRVSEPRLIKPESPRSTFPMWVSTISHRPQIVSFGSIKRDQSNPTKISEGGFISTSFQIKDVTALPHELPEFRTDACDQQPRRDVPHMYAPQYLEMKPAVPTKTANVYDIPVKIDLTKLSLARMRDNQNREVTSAKGLDLCFKFTAKSGRNAANLSDAMPVFVNALYRPTKPNITMSENEKLEAVAGSTLIFHFDIISNESGQLTYTSTEGSLPIAGEEKPTVECNEHSKTHLKCVLNWFVPVDLTTPQKFTVNATHSVERGDSKITETDSKSAVINIISLAADERRRTRTQGKPAAAPKNVPKKEEPSKPQTPATPGAKS